MWDSQIPREDHERCFDFFELEELQHQPFWNLEKSCKLWEGCFWWLTSRNQTSLWDTMLAAIGTRKISSHFWPAFRNWTPVSNLLGVESGLGWSMHDSMCIAELTCDAYWEIGFIDCFCKTYLLDSFKLYYMLTSYHTCRLHILRGALRTCTRTSNI